MIALGALGTRPRGIGTRSAMARNVWVALEDSIDRRPIRAFVVLSFLYFGVVFTLSSFKLLWLDELITLHIARLGSASAIWRALSQGADPNPPVSHLLVLYSRDVFGEHELAYRLPAASGYWVGLLSLFFYLRRILPATWALAGTVLSMTMAAFDYSYESRSYGIFYGLAMFAFLCWGRAAGNRCKTRGDYFWIFGMVFALAAGISTNYFAVLAFLPIAAGELASTISRTLETTRRSQECRVAYGTAILRAIDLRIWLGLLVAATPLIAYRPLIARSIAQFAPYAWNKVSLQQVGDSYTEMVEIVLYPILTLFALGVVVEFVRRIYLQLCDACREKVLPKWLSSFIESTPRRAGIPLHQLVGIFFFMLYPILGYIISSIRGGMLSPRFVIPVCFGFAIAATLVAFRIFGNLRSAGLIFLCFVSAWFVARESVVGYWYEEQKQCFYKIIDHLPEAEFAVPQGAPIVIPDPLLALTFEHYAPRQMALRVVYPMDFPAIRFYRGDDSPEENLWAGRGAIYELRILPLAQFQSSAGTYLVIASDRNWLLEDLGHHHYPMSRLPIDTRAEAIGGFTPLARGTPTFYTASGEAAIDRNAPSLVTPVPFRVQDNLPDATSFTPDGAHQ
jgi:hypothetical protein